MEGGKPPRDCEQSLRHYLVFLHTTTKADDFPSAFRMYIVYILS